MAALAPVGSEMPDILRIAVEIDSPQSGQWNMDKDAALLERGVAGNAALRFYGWNEPTVSLGHFQATQSQAVPERLRGLPVVRRLSGGGAILHHHELTYSCVLPAAHPLSKQPSRLYDLAHEAIIRVLAQSGIAARMRGDAAFEDQSFLCFARGDARDIVIGQHKIVGSAQRRRQGAILQHGSLLLRASEWTPEFPGIQELTGIELEPTLLIEKLSEEIVTALITVSMNSQAR